MVTWIVVAVVVGALLILVAAVAALLGRLSGLQRAARRLQLRQEQALQVQRGAAVLERSVAALQERAEVASAQVAVIRAGRGERDDQPVFLPR